MPYPEFLDDPSLLELPHFPGAINEAREALHLLVTRGGYVAFSSNQLTNIERISLNNGLKNTLRITPENLGKRAGILRFNGDEGLDVILAEGLPNAIVDDEGDYTWLLNNESGILKVVVEKIDVIQKASQ